MAILRTTYRLRERTAPPVPVNNPKQLLSHRPTLLLLFAPLSFSTSSHPRLALDMSSHSPSDTSESASPKTASVLSADSDNLRHVGKCKWFNVAKGYGFLIPDDLEEDVFVHQSELQMEGFRSLADDERVSFFMRQRTTGKGWEAYSVGPEKEGENLVGSSIRPLGKKKEKMIRCYKCGTYGNHLAQRCKKIEASGKVCYHCGADDHLCGVCPKRAKRTQANSGGGDVEVKEETA